MPNKFIITCALPILLAVFTSGCKQGEGNGRLPNIILVMADDMGYECLGSYGGESYTTPNLDQLAAEGMRFTHAFSQPLCTNTRTELMTGKYIYRNWVAFGILDPAEITIGHLMSEQGYATCIVGKWQLQSYDPVDYPGSELRRGIGMHPADAGFDEYCLWHTGHTEDKGSRYADPVILQNGAILENTNGGYGPDIFTQYLTDFIARQKDKPFFVYYPMALPHGPFVPTPDSEEWMDEEMRHSSDNVFFEDMVSYTDKIMGKIMQSLKELELQDNTLLLFYSDNGTHQSIYSFRNGTQVKGGKGLSTDAGIRVPLIACWKGMIQAGTQSDALVYSCDFLPTILHASGSELAQDFICDGVSFLPVLICSEEERRDWIYTDFDPKPGWDKDQFTPLRYVLNHNYKLYDDGRFYHWSTDLLEQIPLDIEAVDTSGSKAYKRFQAILDSIPE